MRALAQRSAKATEEIKALIAESAVQVSEGATLVAQAERTVSAAAAGVQQVVELIGETATASAEQNVGMQAIGKALSQLDSVTQQNAALVEEGSAVATAFEQEAERLMTLVRVFQLSEVENDASTSSARTNVPTPQPATPDRVGNVKPLRLASRV